MIQVSSCTAFLHLWKLRPMLEFLWPLWKRECLFETFPWSRWWPSACHTVTWARPPCIFHVQLPYFLSPLYPSEFFFSFSSLFILPFLSLKQLLILTPKIKGVAVMLNQETCFQGAVVLSLSSVFLTKCRIVFSSWGVLSRIRIYFHTSFILFYLCMLV